MDQISALSNLPEGVLSEEAVLVEERVLLSPEDAKVPLAALCLSGGGIRSATFALGVMQALARFQLLGQFHYLSTVSGGGYIGSWLTAWRHHAKDDAAVLRALDRFTDKDGEEAPQIRGLRANSNYLTPKLGLLSADTWAALALVLRNLILNWLVFTPLFMGLLFVPKFLESALAFRPAHDLAPIPVLIAAGATVIGLASAVRGRLQASGNWLKNGMFLIFVAMPLIAAAMATTYLAEYLIAAPSIAWAAALGACCYAVAWCIGCGCWAVAIPAVDRSDANVVRWKDLFAFAVAGSVAGLLVAAGLHARFRFDLEPAELVVLGPAWVLLSYALSDLVFVGLNSFARRGEQDREWLARYGGWLLATAATFAVICSIDFYVPLAMHWSWGKGTGYLASLGISGAITLVLGASRLTGATTSRQAVEPFKLSTVVSVAALVFAACLGGALSVADDSSLCALAGDPAVSPSGRRACGLLEDGHAIAWQLVCFVALVALAVFLSWFINVNRFSLHALYRNRLVRAFLGSARLDRLPIRDPDPFSGFDPKDNLRMAATQATGPKDKVRLFHVINMTLNTVATDNLAWQERKAEPFTVTALHSGNKNPHVGYRPTASYGDRNGGITLGTAMAISGAAVSPNSGYHSSPLVGMLLSLFNLRLGWWLGNPSGGKSRLEGPSPGLLPALEELAGLTNDAGEWIYMSDGGHFENLGLYSMVQRKCRYIVVSDAGCDPDSAFEDLGNAVRKIYIDLGVSIDFKSLQIPSRKSPPEPGFYCAVGTIHYPPGAGCTPGWLLYVKPSYRNEGPAHVRSYAIANPTFPHESTAEQWFTESQFEAYRALGAYITELICTGGDGIAPGPGAPAMDIDDLVRKAEVYLSTPRHTV